VQKLADYLASHSTPADRVLVFGFSAGAYVKEHPALAARIGNEIARERVESVLYGLAILGQPAPLDLGFLLPRVHPAAHEVRFPHPLRLMRDGCNPYPWAHVSLLQRAGLRSAYAATLRDRLALSAPPVVLRCPTGGCLFCGVAAVNRAAIEVARRGGVEAATRAVWRPVLVLPTSLGGSGPKHVDGHACPDCASAIDDVGGIGWRARARAVVSYLSQSSPQKAQRLRSILESDFPPALPGWGALPEPRSPNRNAWTHLDGLINRL